MDCGEHVPMTRKGRSGTEMSDQNLKIARRTARKRSLFDRKILLFSVKQSFVRLDPRV